MKRLLIGLLPCMLLTACLNTNKQVKLVPSPDGQYHAQIRECQVRGSLTPETRFEVIVTRSDADEQCYSAMPPVLFMFLSPRPVEKLQLDWVSNIELRVRHADPSYWPPSVQTDRKGPIKVTFEPAR
ncbi:hypothetical protein ACILG0_04595 [Pseudomonadota bacterium AL_CKDN230030165-1A_HGKHYDSX7]